MKKLRSLSVLLVLALLAGLLPAFAHAEGESLPYWIGVDVKNQRVTVYSAADNGVVHRWLCSAGTSSTPTPTGTYTLPNSSRKEWNKFGSVYVKWATKIHGGYYFHSILFSSRNDNSLQQRTLKLLGHPASHGCIRLQVAHAKWISDNCAPGTKVIIHKGVDDKRITGVLGHNAELATTPSLPEPPTVKSLALDKTGTVTLGKGETLPLVCTVFPANAETKLTWKSSNSKRATVNASGLVIAVGSGVATITVTASNGVKATVKVDSVDPTVAKSVKLDQKGTQYVNVGETLQLSATVVPATAAGALNWKTGKAKVATVDASGLVTAVARGSCKITVLTANKKKSTITVKVLDPYAPARVDIAQKGPITLHVGETAQLTAVPTPATSKTGFTWTTNKARIATVDGSGLVTAVKKGTAKITVRTANKRKATIVVKVID